MDRCQLVKDVGWALAAVGAVVGALAFPFDLYGNAKTLDEVLHFTTSLALGIVLSAYCPRRSALRTLDVVSIAALVLALGVLWEVVEWAMLDLPLRRNDKADTMVDLCLDGAGGLLGALGARIALDAPRRSARSAA